MSLVGSAPPLALVDAAAEGVEDRVDVGADAQAEERDVVAGVSDHGDPVRSVDDCVGRAVLEVVQQSTEEAGPAHSSGQGGDAHAPILSAPCAPEASGAPLGANITFALDGRGMTRM